ncbi:hydrolase [Rhodococcoides trifolii]|uniref:Hydrolase n=1 Tax=Rhodococcoides trifolii TaxID=908250 RepID=A0A917FT63_9NOCA|nr:carbon-nitrogen hydrolase family protein [Rhodococcus trifolii]GGF99653.1 hydrolase [Rhodococcus trifolii]
MESMRIAVGQPLVGTDLTASVSAHAALVLAARADVMVFPEMSLTGYRLDADPVNLDRLNELVLACRAVVTCALVGAPIVHNGQRAIAVLRVDSDGVSVAYRKSFLAEDEKAHFEAGPGATAIEIDGWRFGLGVCKDTGVDEHIDATAALDVDVYACGVVHHRSELAEQRRRATDIASRCDAYVAMASFAGPTGGGYDRTAGTSLIVSPYGETLAQASELAGDYTAVTIHQSL